MHDDKPLLRQWCLLRMLSSRHYGVTLREMARELGVTEKTVSRYLDEFKRVGFPVESTTGERSRNTWKLGNGGCVPPVSFTYDEAVGLYLGRRFLEPMAGTQLWEATNRAMRKIRAMLSKSALEYVERFPQLFHCTGAGAGNYAAKAEIIDALSLAVDDRKAVVMTYQSRQATEPATRDVYPYILVWHKGSLYLLAFAPEHDEVRRYKVNRIESVEVTSFTFQRPAEFDVKDYLARSFGIYDGDDEITVVVKFAPAVARVVQESNWSETQVLTLQRDGSLIAQFFLSSTVEVKTWILSFGMTAVVQEPEELRAEIARELEQMLKDYQSPIVTGEVTARR